MKCKAFWKWNLILWITILTIQLTGYTSAIAAFAQTPRGPAGMENAGTEMHARAELLTGASYSPAASSKISIGSAVITTKSKEYEYTGNYRQPNPTVKLGSKVLTKDVDYTVKYSNNRDVGTGTITATGIGNYKGTKSVTFKLVKADLAKAVLSTKYREYEYTGNNRQPNLTVKIGSKVLKKDVDYTVKYSNNRNVGTGTITATGIGNYKGTNSVAFELVKADLTKAVLTTKYTEYEYTGNYRQPNPIVKIGSKVLKKDVDFTVQYSDNRNVGTGTITATGIGNYTGSISATFEIVSADDEEKRILVIETSDMHGWLLDTSSGDQDTFRYRLAYISNVINEARQSGEYDDVLLMDGGDIYQGPPVSNMTKGAAMRAAMDAMNYDAVSLGNHEFDWGVTQYCADDKGTVAPYELGDYSGDPDIPVLASNLYDAETGERVPFTKDYVMLEKAGKKIAVIGYIPDFSVDIMSEKIAPYVIDEDTDHLNSLIEEVNENEKPDATIVLAHEEATWVANRVDSSQVDMVLGGHSHEIITETASNGIPCMQANCFAQGYASAVLVIGPDGSVSVEDVAYTDITEDGDSLLDTEENRQHLDESILDISYLSWNSVWENMSEVLGYTDTPIMKKKNDGVSTAGNWVTGLMLRATEDVGTQIAFYNNGGIRTSFEIPEGLNTRQITINDIYTMLPFGNTILVYDITGPEIARQLADGLRLANFGDQMSGLTFTCRESEDFDITEEYTILSITLDDGTEVDLEDNETTYRVCTSNYNATIPGSVFEQKVPVIPEAESPVDAEALIMAIRAISEENDGYLPVDTGVRGLEVE